MRKKWVAALLFKLMQAQLVFANWKPFVKNNLVNSGVLFQFSIIFYFCCFLFLLFLHLINEIYFVDYR